MSIADKITALQTAKSNIASAITNKGGTVASGDGFSDFASDIATIPSGITPSGSQTFTQNGTYDVTSIAQAIVNVSGGSGPDIAWGEVTPTNQTSMTITLPWEVGSNNDVILVLIAKTDPRANYSTLTLENRTGTFVARSYDGALTEGNTTRSFDFVYNGNEVTITKNPSTGAYILNATSYYWFAISPLANPVMFTMPN